MGLRERSGRIWILSLNKGFERKYSIFRRRYDVESGPFTVGRERVIKVNILWLVPYRTSTRLHLLIARLLS
jgi:hypothetical protein